MRDLTIDELQQVSGGNISQPEGIQLELGLAGVALFVSSPWLALGAIAAAAAIAVLPDPAPEHAREPTAGSSDGASSGASCGGLTVTRNTTGGSKIMVKK